jgi:hypothetical protein
MRGVRTAAALGLLGLALLLVGASGGAAQSGSTVAQLSVPSPVGAAGTSGVTFGSTVTTASSASSSAAFPGTITGNPTLPARTGAFSGATAAVGIALLTVGIFIVVGMPRPGRHVRVRRRLFG